MGEEKRLESLDAINQKQNFSSVHSTTQDMRDYTGQYVYQFEKG